MFANLRSLFDGDVLVGDEPFLPMAASFPPVVGSLGVQHQHLAFLEWQLATWTTFKVVKRYRFFHFRLCAQTAEESGEDMHVKHSGPADTLCHDSPSPHLPASCQLQEYWKGQSFNSLPPPPS